MNASQGSGSPALADFILLNEEIAALVRARLPLESHLARLGAELPTTSADLARRIGRRMEQGESFAAAMEQECAALPPAYRATIIAGAESGQLGPALESLVDSASRVSDLRRVTGIAVLYPLVIVVEVCLLLALVVAHFVPTLSGWTETPRSPLARLAESTWTLPLLTFIVPGTVVLLAGIWWWRSGRIGGAASTRIGSMSALPWARRVYYWGQAASLADLLRLLIERGIPLDQALTLAADATDVKHFRRAAHQLAQQLRRGQVLSPAAIDSVGSSRWGLPPLIRLALCRADDGPTLSNSLRQAADIYHDRAVRKAEWYAQYLPILLTVVIGGTLSIGFTWLVFSPYAAMLHELARWHSR